MKILSQEQINELPYWDMVNYYQKLKDHKFGNIKEGTPLVVKYRSGKIVVFEYRLSGTTDLNGFKHLVYGKMSSIGHAPNMVEIATKEDIEEYIKMKEKEFTNTLNYYKELKERANAK